MSHIKNEENLRRPLKGLLLCAAAWLVFAAAAVPARAKLVDEIALVVDQDAMTRGELEESVQTYFLAQHMKPPAPGTAEYEKAKKAVEDSFIREVLLAEEADREKIEVSDGELDHDVDQEVDNMKGGFATDADFKAALKNEGLTLEDLKQEIRDKLSRRIKAARVLRQKQLELPSAALVSEADVRRYYEKHPRDYEKLKFSIILFRTQDKGKAYASEVEKQAHGILMKLKGGASFAEMAKKYSEDPGTAQNGGEVGMVNRVDLNPALAKGVFSIPVGGLGIVRADQGLYIVKVQYKGKADYASVASDIKDHLQKQQQDTAISRWIDKLGKDAYIVEDGKQVAYEPTAPPEEAPSGAAAPASGGTQAAVSAGAEETPGTSTGTVTMIATPVPGTAAAMEDLYPSLPSVGSWVCHFDLAGFNYGTQDLSDFTPGINVNQSLPFGFGLDAGMALALDPTFEAGVELEALRKTTESVKDNATGYGYKWDSAAAGPALDLGLLIPMDESTNFILSASAGYYFLLGSQLQVTDAGSEKADLSASNWGGKAGGTLEFLLDDHKNSALDLGVDYRLLSFSPLTTKLASGGAPPTLGSPLLNPDGKDAKVDFSGVEVTLGLKFYLGKDYDKESPNF